MSENQEKNINEKDLSEQELQQQYVKKQFAQDSIYYNVKTTERSRPLTHDTIKRLMQDPLTNSEQLKNFSSFLVATNGQYNRIVKYISEIHTFDHYIFPMIVSDSEDDMWKSYDLSANLLQSMNIKYNVGWWARECVEKGDLFLYKLQDKKSTIFKQIPSKYCRISYIEDNVFRYEFDLSLINDTVVAEFPLEIQTAYESYKNNSSKGGSKSNGTTGKAKSKTDSKTNTTNKETKWYTVSDKGFAFNLSGFYIKGFPMFLSLFDAVMNYEDSKDKYVLTSDADNFKLIHMKVPLDKENRPILDYDDIAVYHNSTKRNVPTGVAVATNPFDVEGITLGNNKESNYQEVRQALDEVWDIAGISDMLFNNKKASSEALKKSIVTDKTLLIAFLRQVENYINYELNNQVKGKTKWNVSFVETTHIDKEEIKKAEKELLAFGVVSKLKFMAISGYTPLQAMNILKAEKVMKLNDLFEPVQSSHTQSADSSGDSENGRPSAEDNGEVSDNGEKSIEQR